MKIPIPWACDQCKVHKKETNAWWVASFNEHEGRRIGVTLATWDAVEDLESAAAHLCGADCVTKWLSLNLLS